jgi:hypothetical protein
MLLFKHHTAYVITTPAGLTSIAKYNSTAEDSAKFNLALSSTAGDTTDNPYVSNTNLNNGCTKTMMLGNDAVSHQFGYAIGCRKKGTEENANGYHYQY